MGEDFFDHAGSDSRFCFLSSITNLVFIITTAQTKKKTKSGLAYHGVTSFDHVFCITDGKKLGTSGRIWLADSRCLGEFC